MEIRIESFSLSKQFRKFVYIHHRSQINPFGLDINKPNE